VLVSEELLEADAQAERDRRLGSLRNVWGSLDRFFEMTVENRALFASVSSLFLCLVSLLFFILRAHLRI
jgi:hypothetical protein